MIIQIKTRYKNFFYIMYKNLIYIADFSLPNMSAYMLHVLKMCDAFSEKKCNVRLLVPYKQKNLNYRTLKKKYLLKKSFVIDSFFKNKIKRGFFTYLIYSFKIYNELKNKKKNSLIISRSILPALILNILGLKTILEVHTELRGLTKIIFLISKYLISIDKFKFILIHRNLNNKLLLQKKQFIVLDDCVDLRDFNFKAKKKNQCAYTGSFVKGKGVEIIIKISKKLPNVKFNLYGNKRTLNSSLHDEIRNSKNIVLNNYVTYNRIPMILKTNKVLLMPYEKEAGVLIDDLDVSSYISPLKLFDYLASGSIIIASRKKAYNHILKNYYNCFLINSFNEDEWSKKIVKIINNKFKSNKISINSIKTAKKFSWLDRCQKILEFANK